MVARQISADGSFCLTYNFLAELGVTRAAGASRSLPAGMALPNPGLRNLLVTFATAPGTVALDRSPRAPNHSPFAAALLRAAGLQATPVAPAEAARRVREAGGAITVDEGSPRRRQGLRP